MLLFAFFISGTLMAQDTLLLMDVEVYASKKEFSQLGKKTESPDSAVKAQFRFSSVADLLAATTPLHIKTYGPGGLASTSFRGGSAEQTAVLWNGFNLQNAMTGQSDLGLLPSFLFESVGVEYGGSSALWGSGAVGGSIHLNNRHAFNSGFDVTTNAGAGSYGLRNVSAGLVWSRASFISATKVYGSGSDNNFRYNDPANGRIKRQENAAYHLGGLMQEIRLIPGRRHLVVLNGWYNAGARRLPGFGGTELSKSYQADRALRLTGSWNYVSGSIRSVLRGAMFRDQLSFTDSLVPVFARHTTETLMLENENYYTWGKGHQLSAGISGMNAAVGSSNYQGRRSLRRMSFLLANKFDLFGSRLMILAAARVEYFSAGKLPLTGSAAMEWKLPRNFLAGMNLARVYRQPTLNELYWLPGGNESLRPEEGYTGDGFIRYSRQLNAFSLRVGVAAFSRAISNWVLWVPGSGGNPTPMNIQQVWSRGTETSWRLGYLKGKWQFVFNANTGYVLSTVTRSTQEHNNSVGRQLIYTPRYTASANLLVEYGGTGLILFSQYCGYRFTSSDNLAWIDPYELSSLRLNQHVRFSKADLVVFAACHNLFNEDYQILPARPMPLRHYEFGITLQLSKPVKQIN